MVNFAKNTPQVPVVLASLIVWVSFAWALPGETGEGGAEPATVDPWAGVKVSDAYDYAKCSECGYKNEVRGDICADCGYELPQPSADMADSDVVFVPGMGYYVEGTILEPPEVGRYLWIKGLVLTAAAVSIYIVGRQYLWPLWGIVGFPGIVLLIRGLTRRKEPVYAFADGEAYEPYERPAFSRRPPDAGGEALKVEVTLLNF